MIHIADACKRGSERWNSSQGARGETALACSTGCCWLKWDRAILSQGWNQCFIFLAAFQTGYFFSTCFLRLPSKEVLQQNQRWPRGPRTMTASPKAEHRHYSHYTDEDTEGQWSYMNCRSEGEVGPGLRSVQLYRPSLTWPQLCILSFTLCLWVTLKLLAVFVHPFQGPGICCAIYQGAGKTPQDKHKRALGIAISLENRGKNSVIFYVKTIKTIHFITMKKMAYFKDEVLNENSKEISPLLALEIGILILLHQRR